jgi:hypothetical protein
VAQVPEIFKEHEWYACYGGKIWHDNTHVPRPRQTVEIMVASKGGDKQRGFRADKLRPWPEGPYTLEEVTALPLETPIGARQTVGERIMNEKVLELLERIAMWEATATYTKWVIRNLAALATTYLEEVGKKKPSGNRWGQKRHQEISCSEHR